MRFKLFKVILSSVTLGIFTTLGVPANAVTVAPGTTVLSDTTEFLDFQINLSQITAPPGTYPGPPGPLVPLLLGQNWNVFGSRYAGYRGGGIDLLVEQVTPGASLAGPNAAFSGDWSRGFLSPFPAKQVSYLASAPAQTFNSETCAFGSTNCVSYEFGALYPDIFCNYGPCGTSPGGAPIYKDSIFELKGFFNASNLPPVPEGETGIGALAALGLVLLMRARHNASKQLS